MEILLIFKYIEIQKQALDMIMIRVFCLITIFK